MKEGWKNQKVKKVFWGIFGWKERDKLPGPNGYIQEDPDGEGVFYHPLWGEEAQLRYIHNFLFILFGFFCLDKKYLYNYLFKPAAAVVCDATIRWIEKKIQSPSRTGLFIAEKEKRGVTPRHFFLRTGTLRRVC